ncbi:MAG: MFS transporter [Nitrososphaerales archaeon]
MKLNLDGNLWHHRDFSRLWFSETVSSFGSQFSGLAIQFLAILSFKATSFEYGALLALGILPYPVLGLFVGVWADRFRKRRIMTLCNLGRMATLASIPVAWALGELGLAQLFLVTLTNGVFSVFFDISYQAYLPILVERADLIEGNQKLQVSASGASVAGPAIAGFIYQLIGGALTCAVDAVGYLAASLALLDIKKAEPKKDTHSRDFFSEMKEGIQVVSGNPLLWTIAGSTATSNLGAYMVGSAFNIFMLRNIHYSAGELGLVYTIGALGFVVGALVARRVTDALGFGPGLAVSIAIGGLAVLYPLAAYSLPFVLPPIVAFIIGISSPVYNISQVSLRQAITPNRLQGRMNATMRVIVWGTIPVGSFVGGILGGTIGLTDTMYLGGLIAGLAAVWIVFGPVMKLKTQPEPAYEPTVA